MKSKIKKLEITVDYSYTPNGNKKTYLYEQHFNDYNRNGNVLKFKSPHWSCPRALLLPFIADIKFVPTENEYL